MNIKICKISNVFGPYSIHKSSAIHAFTKKIIQEKNSKFIKMVCRNEILYLQKMFAKNVGCIEQEK